MINKKIFSLCILSLIIISISTITVFAALSTFSTGASAFLQDLGRNISTALTPLLGSGETLSRVFMAILLFLILYMVMEQILGNDKKFLTIAISIIITIITFLALPPSFITSIRASYGAMGAAILSVIPFIILFAFSMMFKGSTLIVQITWIFFCVYYFALYIYEMVTKSVKWNDPILIPYLGAIIAGIIIFFFIKSMRNMIFRGKMDAAVTKAGQLIEFQKAADRIAKRRIEGVEGT